ncbi:MAG TPA: SOS response-associated peptidase [Steroidobacteraceae bacterium]|jgi:putative SOS response-associated peptidase YedK|nr:SOS response-associated peptidase [Steroidobacteraceae bacterium]
MCQRYAFPDQATVEREFMPSRAWWNFSPKYNVGANQYVPSIRWHGGQSEAAMMRWGLIPSFAEGRAGESPLIVEADEVLESPLFRAPWLEGQRCILPMLGFYAWQLTNRRYRQPHFIRLLNRSVFGVAAVWDRSVSEDDDVLESCSIVCVPPNELIVQIANTDGHMPAILRRRDYLTWLKGTPVAAKATLYPYNMGSLQAFPVSPRINSTTADDAALIQPVELA